MASLSIKERNVQFYKDYVGGSNYSEIARLNELSATTVTQAITQVVRSGYFQTTNEEKDLIDKEVKSIYSIKTTGICMNVFIKAYLRDEKLLEYPRVKLSDKVNDLKLDPKTVNCIYKLMQVNRNLQITVEQLVDFIYIDYGMFNDPSLLGNKSRNEIMNTLTYNNLLK